MSQYNLTKKQRECLDFIGAYIEINGYSPSYDEITTGIGLKSKSGAHRLIHALEERGFIELLPHRGRSIALKPVISDHTMLLRESLRQQCDNMAFVLNVANVPDQWYSKFKQELEQARELL